VQLSESIKWEELESSIKDKYSEKTGSPGKSLRLMLGLQYLKYLYDESDEQIVLKFVENPYYQYFCGNQHFEHHLPIDPSSMTRFRKRIGKDKIELLLKGTIEAAKDKSLLNSKDYRQLNVDTTVQEKNITFPTDSKLYYVMIQKLGKQAKEGGINLRQSFKRVSKQAFIKQHRYSHAKQYKRAKKMQKKLKTFLGRLYRDILRKSDGKDEKLNELLSIAERLLKQERHSKNKIYSIHAPEVECISKGKAHKKYEFGNKVSMVTTSKGNWVVGIKAFHGNPYDGHTLKEAIEQSEELTDWKAENIYVDLGYRGHNYQGHAKVNIVNLTKQKNKPKKLLKWLKRRSAIEPIFGHLKNENRMDRNKLKGRDGDHINAVLAACGFNLRKLYNVFPIGMKFHLLPILNLIAKRFLTEKSVKNLKYSFYPNNFIARFWVFQ
jgi:IS5 family transposase